ncbi:hypothetical protein SAMN04488556_4167 [Halostagnicola kamekurae]|uniref:Uncharacterized protein n=2 Tax=Halostagnicola kamekurae TaxID=619731 RepID=A0A1I6UYE3_9EURY|nr:hypothetical protein SAMN04488556_4167 [Halostagnicola kamekurae]
MVNENFEPSDRQEALLSVLTEGRRSGDPWGYATVKRFTEETDLRKQYVNRELEGLLGAGWVEKPYRGLYKYVEDPRGDDPDV